VVKQVLVGSYKQIDIDSPVYIRANGKNSYIGRKKSRTLFNELVVDSCKGDLKLDRKTSRHCFGFYEVNDCG
jgi:hypothetical protein|tara:strand:+ start:1587 stop:1802 length:216 start_codon:yes stop_codon:yes gene_type:complete